MLSRPPIWRFLPKMSDEEGAAPAPPAEPAEELFKAIDRPGANTGVKVAVSSERVLPLLTSTGRAGRLRGCQAKDGPAAARAERGGVAERGRAGHSGSHCARAGGAGAARTRGAGQPGLERRGGRGGRRRRLPGAVPRAAAAAAQSGAGRGHSRCVSAHLWLVAGAYGGSAERDAGCSAQFVLLCVFLLSHLFDRSIPIRL